MSLENLVIPKPEFLKADETSIGLKLNLIVPEGFEVKLHYKSPYEPWENSKFLTIDPTDGSLNSADVINLEPGTPYSIRIGLHAQTSEESKFGPETVFDTQPIDCTPKRKKCIIS